MRKSEKVRERVRSKETEKVEKVGESQRQFRENVRRKESEKVEKVGESQRKSEKV